MSLRADLVTVFHNEHNYRQHQQLRAMLGRHEPGGGYAFIRVDNRRTNRGFGGGCNAGAFTKGANSPIIGFLNPDAIIRGPFIDKVSSTLTGPIVITGCRFNKPTRELNDWGVADWVCGAALFVTRHWFTSVGGFDPQFVWGWEETDLIRQAQAAGYGCRSIDLPIEHDSPSTDSPTDSRYKQYHFKLGAQRFYSKWPRGPGFKGH